MPSFQANLFPWDSDFSWRKVGASVGPLIKNCADTALVVDSLYHAGWQTGPILEQAL